jgi:hypothetical protein
MSGIQTHDPSVRACEDRAATVIGESSTYTIEIPEEKRPLGRPRSRWEDNTERACCRLDSSGPG